VVGRRGGELAGFHLCSLHSPLQASLKSFKHASGSLQTVLELRNDSGLARKDWDSQFSRSGKISDILRATQHVHFVQLREGNGLGKWWSALEAEGDRQILTEVSFGSSRFKCPLRSPLSLLPQSFRSSRQPDEGDAAATLPTNPCVEGEDGSHQLQANSKANSSFCGSLRAEMPTYGRREMEVFGMWCDPGYQGCKFPDLNLDEKFKTN